MYTAKFMFDYGADSCLWGTEDEGLLSTQSFPISQALRGKLEGLSIEYNSILNGTIPQQDLFGLPSRSRIFV